MPGTIEKPRGRSVTFSEGDERDVREYVEECERISVMPPPVRMLALKLFLAERRILVYNGRAVHDYLVQLAKEKKANYYEMCPLRQEDVGTTLRWWYDQEGKRVCNDSKRVYNKIIPSSVLQTVATIRDAFSDAKFLVTDIPDEQDPFLLVTFVDQFALVVDVWAEPGFRPS